MSEDTRVDTGQQRLIEIPEQPPKPFRVIAPTNPVWTENKAQFIMRYLRRTRTESAVQPESGRSSNRCRAT